MKYLKNYSKFYSKSDQTNESMKTWLTSFLLMANLGLVPPSLKAADSESKKEFIESQPQDKIDAVVFYEYLKNFGNGKPIDSIWEKFLDQNKNIESSLGDVKKYITQDGKNYYFEKDYSVYDFSNVDIHKFTPVNWLTDMGGFIPDRLEPNINNWISDYEKKTSIEIGIITVQSLGNTPIEDYANEQFNLLGIGKKGADNGILIVVSMDDRKSRIETGYGMEGFLPDLKCYRILEDQIKPNFKNGDYYGGIMKALEEIRSYLGDEAFEEKVKWLKEKKQKEDQESAEWWNAFWDNMILALLISLVLGSIGYVVYRGQKAKKIKKDIENGISMMDQVISSYPKSSPINSKYIKSELNRLNEIIKDVEKQFRNVKSDSVSKKEDILIRINELRGMAEEAINKYMLGVSAFDKKVSDISNLNSITNDAFSTVDKAINAYKKISDYGYRPPESPNRSDIDSLIPLALLAASILLSNVDDAVENSEKFKSKISDVVDKSKKVINTLSTIETAKSNIQNVDSIIQSKLREMDSYSKWSSSGERSEIESKVNLFKSEISNLGTKPDYLSLDKKLSTLILEIEKVKSKWYSRKRAEEEEEERRRREIRRREEEAAESRRRSSKSSGGSSFGGFSGSGRSGGGGASSGW